MSRFQALFPQERCISRSKPYLVLSELACFSKPCRHVDGQASSSCLPANGQSTWRVATRRRGGAKTHTFRSAAPNLAVRGKNSGSRLPSAARFRKRFLQGAKLCATSPPPDPVADGIGHNGHNGCTSPSFLRLACGDPRDVSSASHFLVVPAVDLFPPSKRTMWGACGSESGFTQRGNRDPIVDSRWTLAVYLCFLLSRRDRGGSVVGGVATFSTLARGEAEACRDPTGIRMSTFGTRKGGGEESKEEESRGLSSTIFPCPRLVVENDSVTDM